MIFVLREVYKWIPTLVQFLVMSEPVKNCWCYYLIIKQRTRVHKVLINKTHRNFSATTVSMLKMDRKSTLPFEAHPKRKVTDLYHHSATNKIYEDYTSSGMLRRVERGILNTAAEERQLPPWLAVQEALDCFSMKTETYPPPERLNYLPFDKVQHPRRPESSVPLWEQGCTQGEEGCRAAGPPPPPKPAKPKFKKHRFRRYYNIKSFSLQPKSPTEIGWWLVLSNIEKQINKIKNKKIGHCVWVTKHANNCKQCYVLLTVWFL
jgi:hypothetical protein